jgi:hypothetical protein
MTYRLLGENVVVGGRYLAPIPAYSNTVMSRVVMSRVIFISTILLALKFQDLQGLDREGLPESTPRRISK